MWAQADVCVCSSPGRVCLIDKLNCSRKYSVHFWNDINWGVESEARTIGALLWFFKRTKSTSKHLFCFNQFSQNASQYPVSGPPLVAFSERSACVNKQNHCRLTLFLKHKVSSHKFDLYINVTSENHPETTDWKLFVWNVDFILLLPKITSCFWRIEMWVKPIMYSFTWLISWSELKNI